METFADLNCYGLQSTVKVFCKLIQGNLINMVSLPPAIIVLQKLGGTRYYYCGNTQLL